MRGGTRHTEGHLGAHHAEDHERAGRRLALAHVRLARDGARRHAQLLEQLLRQRAQALLPAHLRAREGDRGGGARPTVRACPCGSRGGERGQRGGVARRGRTSRAGTPSAPLRHGETETLEPPACCLPVTSNCEGSRHAREEWRWWCARGK